MIVLDVDQGGDAWIGARLGIPTSSGFSRILTPATLQPSKQAGAYRNELLAEHITGYPTDDFRSGWTQRGSGLEDEARRWYEFDRECEIRQTGLVLRDDGLCGGSPDGLAGEDGGVEIKCPALKTHIGYLVEPETLVAAYNPQVQGYLYLTGRAWWDLVSFAPGMPAVVRRVFADPKHVAALSRALDAFCAHLENWKKELSTYRTAPEYRPYSAHELVR